MGIITNNGANLVRLPALPSGTRSKVYVDCKCGCGGQTQSTFVPGHDSRLRGWILRVERGVMTLAEIASYATQGEADATAAAMVRLGKVPPTVEEAVSEDA